MRGANSRSGSVTGTYCVPPPTGARGYDDADANADAEEEAEAEEVEEAAAAAAPLARLLQDGERQPSPCCRVRLGGMPFRCVWVVV